MSGVRQHFIPRFLQKGFLSKIKGEISYSWVFQKDRPPRESNIRDIGLEKYFYSFEKEKELDDLITYKEGEFGNLIHILRRGSDILDEQLISELFAHLEIRSKNLRENSFNVLFETFSEVDRVLSDKSQVNILLGKLVSLDSPFFRKEIEIQRKSSNISKSAFIRFLKENPSFLDAARESVMKGLNEALIAQRDNIHIKIKDLAKNGQLKALKKDLCPPQKAEMYRKLNYKVIVLNSIRIPLGDSMVLFKVDSERGYKPFIEKKDILQAAILPISYDRVLIGTVDGSCSLALDTLPNEIASCSTDFFISSENGPILKSLQENIGKNSSWIDSGSIKKIINDVFSEAIYNLRH